MKHAARVREPEIRIIYRNDSNLLVIEIDGNGTQPEHVWAHTTPYVYASP